MLPLDDRPAFALFRAAMRPGLPTSRTRFVYRPPLSHIVSDACPPAARGWTTTIDLDHPEGAGDGALIARGSLNSGFVLYVKDGPLRVRLQRLPRPHAAASRTSPLAPGRAADRARGDPRSTAAARARRSASTGDRSGEAQIPRLLFIISSTGMDLGRSPGAGERRLRGPVRLSGPHPRSGVRGPAPRCRPAKCAPRCARRWCGSSDRVAAILRGAARCCAPSAWGRASRPLRHQR